MADHADRAEDEFQRLVLALQAAERERDEARAEGERKNEALRGIAQGARGQRDVQFQVWRHMSLGDIEWIARAALPPPEAARTEGEA